MDQVKIGRYLQELRKEKGYTQEQLAEHLNVARRTVSRWETGSNMPDLDLLIELSDFYGVGLRELLDGERKEKEMNREMEETVMKVAEYSNAEKERMSKVVMRFFILGILALLVNLFMEFNEIAGTAAADFVKGLTIGIAFGVMLLGILYLTGYMNKFREFKLRLIGRK